MSLVNILYNYQLLRLAGENGVAAYGVIMYACFLFIAVYVGCLLYTSSRPASTPLTPSWSRATALPPTPTT